jgi:hypothetical protein|tara:strand:- start:124 stop:420 length:297 start_codon:yes stop_codon:yes gene_type:complete
MTNKHSPAPWSVYYDDDGVEIRADGNMMGGFINGNEMRANKDLIEAAPKLLAALRSLAFAYSLSGDHIDGHQGDDCVYCDALAAIAKATGKPSPPTGA